jgi:hypothetical protein
MTVFRSNPKIQAKKNTDQQPAQNGNHRFSHLKL